MSDPRKIMAALNPHVSRILTVAETALPPANYNAFRKFTLDELGDKGFESELKDLCRPESGEDDTVWNGMGRSQSGMKGGAP